MTQGDFVALDLGSTETTETTLGTITVPSAGISRIVGVYGSCSLGEATLKEGALAHFRLAFKTVPGVYKFPALLCGGGTTSTGNSIYGDFHIIPVNINVPANETITCYMTLTLAQSGTAHGLVGVIFE